jgi:hypothetical protein
VPAEKGIKKILNFSFFVSSYHRFWSKIVPFNKRHKGVLREPNKMRIHFLVVMLNEVKHLGLERIKEILHCSMLRSE